MKILHLVSYGYESESGNSKRRLSPLAEGGFQKRGRSPVGNGGGVCVVEGVGEDAVEVRVGADAEEGLEGGAVHAVRACPQRNF